MLRSFVQGLRYVDTADAVGARARVWRQLEPALQTPEQWLGRVSPGCFATHQVHERCDFACTACYLARTANQTPPLPFAEVKAQLDAIRATAGPGGNVQITAGEVTLLPPADLVRIVRYARDLGLDPMLMTHGQTFDRDPSYLHRLMLEAGLMKVSIHVDTTQRGRIGQPTTTRETDLDPVRERFAALIRDARRVTGRPLHAASTVTVTADNLDQIPDVVRWMARNADAFRMLGLNPTAAVGRTRVAREGDSDGLHDRICEGLGRRVSPTTFTFGHPRCSRVVLMWVVRFGDRFEVVEVRRDDHALDRWFFRQLMGGAFPGFSLDDATPPEAAGRVLRLIARSPRYAWQWPLFAVSRLVGEREWLPAFARAAAAGAPWWVRPFAVVVHAFMSPEQLDTVEGRARLAACAFRVPVEGQMVPMCEVNATSLRRELNVATRARLVNVAEPTVPGAASRDGAGRRTRP